MYPKKKNLLHIILGKKSCLVTWHRTAKRRTPALGHVTWSTNHNSAQTDHVTFNWRARKSRHFALKSVTILVQFKSDKKVDLIKKKKLILKREPL